MNETTAAGLSSFGYVMVAGAALLFVIFYIFSSELKRKMSSPETKIKIGVWFISAAAAQKAHAIEFKRVQNEMKAKLIPTEEQKEEVVNLEAIGDKNKPMVSILQPKRC